jgi:hypothetical protein
MPGSQSNLDGKDCKALEAYVRAKYDSCKNVHDTPLWAIFKQDFWEIGPRELKEAPFQHLHSLTVRLRTNGICVSTEKPWKITDNLYAVREEATPRPWTEKDATCRLADS